MFVTKYSVALSACRTLRGGGDGQFSYAAMESKARNNKVQVYWQKLCNRHSWKEWEGQMEVTADNGLQ